MHINTKVFNTINISTTIWDPNVGTVGGVWIQSTPLSSCTGHVMVNNLPFEFTLSTS